MMVLKEVHHTLLGDSITRLENIDKQNRIRSFFRSSARIHNRRLASQSN